MVDQCNLVQSGARLLDSLMDRDILPGVSNLLLQRVAEGTQGNRIVVGLGEDGTPFFRLDDGTDLVADESTVAKAAEVA